MEELDFQISITKDSVDSDGVWVSYILKNGDFAGHLFSLKHPVSTFNDEVSVTYFYAKLDPGSQEVSEVLDSPKMIQPFIKLDPKPTPVVEALEPTKESDEMAVRLSIFTQENFDALLYNYQKVFYNK